MTYIEHIKNMKASGICPFCEEYKHWLIIEQNDTAYVLLARAPYTPGHLLVCTKRHTELLSDLTPQELVDIQSLIIKREHYLYQHYGEVVVFLRQGVPFGVTGKSLAHFHRHIVPNFTIKYGGTQEASDNRKCYSDEEYRSETEKWLHIGE